MRTFNDFRALLILVLVTGGLIPAVVRAGAEEDAAALARRLTTAGAARFEARDAAALAASYDDEAEAVLVSRGDADLKRDVRRGRSAIEGLYADLFRDGKAIRARNTVEHARFLSPEVLLITGSFELSAGTEAPLVLPFTQVRHRHGDTWKIHHLEVFLLPRG